MKSVPRYKVLWGAPTSGFGFWFVGYQPPTQEQADEVYRTYNGWDKKQPPSIKSAEHIDSVWLEV